MNIMDYQVRSKKFVNKELIFKEQISYLSMGLAGETGEVVDYIKKCVYHGHSLEIRKLVEELGDVLWYLTNIATLYGIPMTYILDVNIKKLEERYPEGFSEEKSINRKEYK